MSGLFCQQYIGSLRAMSGFTARVPWKRKRFMGTFTPDFPLSHLMNQVVLNGLNRPEPPHSNRHRAGEYLKKRQCTLTCHYFMRTLVGCLGRCRMLHALDVGYMTGKNGIGGT